MLALDPMALILNVKCIEDSIGLVGTNKDPHSLITPSDDLFS